jgi:Leucine-rich repeat (LRR) protein
VKLIGSLLVGKNERVFENLKELNLFGN